MTMLKFGLPYQYTNRLYLQLLNRIYPLPPSIPKLVPNCPRPAAAGRGGHADYSQLARSGNGTGDNRAINAAFEVFPAKVDSREGANTVRKQKFRAPEHF